MVRNAGKGELKMRRILKNDATYDHCNHSIANSDSTCTYQIANSDHDHYMH